MTEPETGDRLHVAEFNNPAGRLFALLSHFAEQGGDTILEAWSTVLGVAEEDVPIRLGEVATLLQDVRRAAKDTGSDAFDPIEGHLRSLAGSVFPTGVPFSGNAKEVRPDPSSMQALRMLSVYLERVAPEGTIPDEDELEELLEAVRQLIGEVGAHVRLPPEIRRAVLHRLNEMLQALEHLDIGGPYAVRRAAEALAITAMLYEHDAVAGDDDRNVVSKLKSLARKTWLAFTVTSTFAGAVLTWDRILDLHLLPPVQQEQRLLAPGPPASGNEPWSSRGVDNPPGAPDQPSMD
jgi:hypothetical protein